MTERQAASGALEDRVVTLSARVQPKASRLTKSMHVSVRRLSYFLPVSPFELVIGACVSANDQSSQSYWLTESAVSGYCLLFFSAKIWMHFRSTQGSTPIEIDDWRGFFSFSFVRWEMSGREIPMLTFPELWSTLGVKLWGWCILPELDYVRAMVAVGVPCHQYLQVYEKAGI